MSKTVDALNRHTLGWIINFMNKAVSYEEFNKMGQHNMALMFAPNIFRSRGNSVMEMSNLGVKVELTKMMMTNFSSIFVDFEDMEGNPDNTQEKLLL